MTGLSPGSGLVGPPGVALRPGLGSQQVGVCLAAGPPAAACSLFPAGGHLRAEDAAGRVLGKAEGLHRGLPLKAAAGSVGAGARAGVCCGGLARGWGLLPGLLPPTHSPPPGGSSLRTGQSREVAGRGLLASCLLSRGLISKTGRLVLTEAADGTADAPARLSSWGPAPAPVGCS